MARRFKLLLRLKNIGKIYDSNDILTIGIRGVNLDFDYNEFVTIEGESGSGKSTLLNVIAANDSYEEGELYFNGAETSHYSETDWEKYREKNIAMIFQDFNIIENLTVLENVELALLRVEDKIERRKTAEDLIAKVGLTAQKNRKGSKLSGGEKQRTVIARALAKDSPVILADEPTGNLDVKASKEVAALLKAVSKDKLVIVVTHNPEFFVEYATRRVTIFDGSVKEDQVIRKPLPKTSADKEEIKAGKWQNFKNTMHIGTLNYKSRPKFTAMMSFALFVCAITLFLVISVFGNSLIRPTQVPLDGTGVTGKVILSNRSNSITQSDLDEVAGQTKAGYFLLDRNLSEFSVDIPKRGGLSSSYTLTCLYDPYKYCPEAGNAVLIMSKSEDGDAETIKNMIVNAEIGIKNITLKTTVDLTEPKLYLGYDDLNAYGKKMQAVNSVMKLGNNETTVFTFRAGEELAAGEINLVNSNFYAADGKQVVFNAKTDKSYVVVSSDKKKEDVSGLIVEMNAEDYAAMFAGEETSVQSALYYASDGDAKAAGRIYGNAFRFRRVRAERRRRIYEQYIVVSCSDCRKFVVRNADFRNLYAFRKNLSGGFRRVQNARNFKKNFFAVVVRADGAHISAYACPSARCQPDCHAYAVQFVAVYFCGKLFLCGIHAAAYRGMCGVRLQQKHQRTIYP